MIKSVPIAELNQLRCHEEASAQRWRLACLEVLVQNSATPVGGGSSSSSPPEREAPPEVSGADPVIESHFAPDSPGQTNRYGARSPPA